MKRKAMVALACLALFLGVTSTGWMIAVVHQWLLPWSSFRIFLPAGAALTPIVPQPGNNVGR